MGIQTEKVDDHKIKMTIEVGAEKFLEALQEAYRKQRGKINMPGFRKGKAPYAMIKKAYGVEVFYEDAANVLIPEAYEEAADECEYDVVSQPEIDVVQMEEGKPFIFTAEVTVKPEVTLGEYKGVTAPKAETEVTDEDVMMEVDRAREQNARMITVDERKTEEGDIVVIDFEGFMDGEAFEGGKGNDYPLTLGSNSFIPGFEDQLVGRDVGTDVDVNVTFPDDYQAEELKGKEALFKVTVKEIKKKELPELDDEFVEEVSEFDTVDEYKDDIRKRLLEGKEREAKKAKENAVIDAIIENATMDVPDVMVDTQMRQMMEEFVRGVQAQGVTLEQYMQLTGMTQERMIEEMKPSARKRIESRLVLEAVAKAEDIQVSEEDVDKEIEDMAAAYKLELEKMKERIGERERKQIGVDIAVQRAVDLVVEAAV